MENRDIKTLSTIEHILLRAQMYIGGMTPSEHEAWVFNEDGTISLSKIIYTEGLLKIINEVLDNSVDEHTKTDGKFSTKISITMEDDHITIEDNGRGIPVKKDSNGEWMCVNAVCKPMSGSNFDDSNENKGIGLNGIGSKSANIFSKKFECTTSDGKHKMKIACKDNLSVKKYSMPTDCDKHGTSITFYPDFERFGVKKFDESIFTMVRTRLKFLSFFYPKCNFTFNGEKVNIKNKELSTMFPSPNVVISSDTAYICIYPSDEPKALTYVNGIYLRRGGNHVDYIMNKVIADIREKVGKKFKNIKPADIRNRLGIVVLFKGFSNCSFDSQTKETLTNSQGEISEYLRSNDIDLDKLSSKVIKEKDILDNITELFRLKEELAEKKALNELNKKTKKELESEKYYPPIGKSEKKLLMLCEGASARGGLMPVLGRVGIGYYELKGKVINCDGLSTRKILENKEANEIVNILGIDITNPNESEITYEKVVVCSDADFDGISISGLLINFFNRLCPKLIKENRLCRLETPLLIGMKNDKVAEYYFTMPNKEDMKPNLKYMYIKGLGGWNKSRFDQVIEKEGGSLDCLLKPYHYDDTSDKSIKEWFGEDTEPRKIALRGREFHIDKA